MGNFDGIGVRLEYIGDAGDGSKTQIALSGDGVEFGGAASPAVLNSIATGNDFVMVYPTIGVNETLRSTDRVLPLCPIKHINDTAGKTIPVNKFAAYPG